MNISQLVETCVSRFTSAGVDNPKRVAEELLAHVLDCKPLEIYTHSDMEQTECLRLLEPLARRIEAGEPIQYIVGHVGFWDLEVKCDHRALIPRPETELLVEEILASKIWANKQVTVIDVGTGTGCIVLTLAKQHPDADFKAVDISPVALELARENAHLLGLEDKISWIENPLLDNFEPESYDAVVANLPYVASNEWESLPRSVRGFEPQSALDSGPSGMELIEQLAVQARHVLVPGGMLFLEIGYDQGRPVSQLLERLGYADIQIKHDLAGLDRVAIAENP